MIPHSTKASTSTIQERIVFPLPPSSIHQDSLTHDIYKTFMKKLGNLPYKQQPLHALREALAATALSANIGTALVAKTLCNLGLRAPRAAFPAAFLDFVDRAIKSNIWDHSTPACVMGLRDYWRFIGDFKRPRSFSA